MELDIGGNEIVMPLDWHVLVGDPMAGNDLEILPLTVLTIEGSKHLFLIRYRVILINL